MREVCAVRGCYQCVKGRHLCPTHYLQWRSGRLVALADAEAGTLKHGGTSIPLVCSCEQPQPDAIGQCALCFRRVVTYTHPDVRQRYALRYPDLWDRAMTLGLHP